MKIELTRDEPLGFIGATVTFDKDTVSHLYRSWDKPQWWLDLSDDIEVSIEPGTPLADALDQALAEEVATWTPAM